MGELDNRGSFSGHRRRRVSVEIRALGLMLENRFRLSRPKSAAGPGALRRLAELASRGVVLRRRLPARFGSKRLYVSPECGLRYWWFDLGMIDPVLLDLAEHLVRPGDVVWDVGANVGLFTFAAAHRAARVLAFEPDPWLADLLERTAAFFPNVSVIRAAVADYGGQGELHIARRARGSNFLLGQGSSQSGGRGGWPRSRWSRWILSTRLLLNVLKIDVETGELAVLSGAARLLAQSQPIVICEVAKENVSAVTACLRGYTLFDAERSKPVNTAVWNTVAVPAAALCPTPLDLATVEG